MINTYSNNTNAMLSLLPTMAASAASGRALSEAPSTNPAKSLGEIIKDLLDNVLSDGKVNEVKDATNDLNSKRQIDDWADKVHSLLVDEEGSVVGDEINNAFGKWESIRKRADEEKEFETIEEFIGTEIRRMKKTRVLRTGEELS